MVEGTGGRGEGQGDGGCINKDFCPNYVQEFGLCKVQENFLKKWDKVYKKKQGKSFQWLKGRRGGGGEGGEGVGGRGRGWGLYKYPRADINPHPLQPVA